MRKKVLFSVIIIIAFGFYFLRIPVKQVTFGFYAGECMDSCQVVYSVSKHRITKDVYSIPTKDFNSNKSISHKYLEEDENGSFNKYKPWIPILMLIDSRSRIGCPDCMDQGGVIIEFEVFGIVKHFDIDPDKIPLYYFDMRQNLNPYRIKIDEELK